MAEETSHKQEFHLRHLPTRRVTLYPKRAEIVRDIEDIALKVCSHHQVITNSSS